MLSTNMQKEKAGRKEKSGQENQREKNSGRTGAKEILEIEESIWKSRVREDASAKGLGPCNRVKGKLCVQKREVL